MNPGHVTDRQDLEPSSFHNVYHMIAQMMTATSSSTLAASADSEKAEERESLEEK